MTPRRLGRRACANHFDLTDAQDKKTWVTFWMGSDKHVDVEDSDPLEVEGGCMEFSKEHLRLWHMTGETCKDSVKTPSENECRTLSMLHVRHDALAYSYSDL